MKKHVPGKNNDLFNALTSNGVTGKVASELQNVHNYCNLSGFEIVNDGSVAKSASAEMFYIFGKGAAPDEFGRLLGSGEKVSAALLNRKLARRTTGGNVTIERHRYTLIFKDPGLPVQAFKL